MYEPADFARWDYRDRFTLTEAAWLWCGKEPPASGVEYMPALGKGIQPHPVIKNLPALGYDFANAAWKAICDGSLIILTKFPDKHYKIPRAYLKKWVEQNFPDRPRFLFHDIDKSQNSSPETGQYPQRAKNRQRNTERSFEHERWKKCGEEIQQGRKQKGMRPLNKSDLAAEVIGRLDLRDSPETVRKRL